MRRSRSPQCRGSSAPRTLGPAGMDMHTLWHVQPDGSRTHCACPHTQSVVAKPEHLRGTQGGHQATRQGEALSPAQAAGPTERGTSSRAGGSSPESWLCSRITDSSIPAAQLQPQPGAVLGSTYEGACKGRCPPPVPVRSVIASGSGMLPVSWLKEAARGNAL